MNRIIYDLFGGIIIYLIIDLSVRMYNRINLNINELIKEKSEIEIIKDDIKKLKLFFIAIIIMFLLHVIINFYMQETFIDMTLKVLNLNRTVRINTLILK